ncbi:MAG: GreA/GreB family elongation factor [Sphingomicrobium sp.]
MSVAFRRDSDEEHLEPKFELPVPVGPNMVTPRGHALIAERNATLEAELDRAEDETRRKELQRDLRYWRSRLTSAQIAPRPSGNEVAIGTEVEIIQGGARRTFTIVGHDEADPAAGLIAFGAPVARMLMGCEAGEQAEPTGGQAPIDIVAVRPSDRLGW